MALCVGFQGEHGAYSEQAVYRFFGKKVKSVPFKDFAGVFSAVKLGKVRFGVLPFENSLTGSIHQNFDLIINHRVRIVGEVKLPIEHCLLAAKGADLGNLREVYSHPQALEQCQSYLRKFKNARPVPYFDTAGSAKYVGLEGRSDIAAIASEQAAHDYGLQVLAKGIADNTENYTRFLVLEKNSSTEPKKKPGTYKTSIVFALGNMPGALYKSLSIFAIRDIDLLKIESRPIPGSPWSYVFYLDFAGHIHDDASKRAVAHLSEITAMMRVLGSYQPGVSHRR